MGNASQHSSSCQSSRAGWEARGCRPATGNAAPWGHFLPHASSSRGASGGQCVCACGRPRPPGTVTHSPGSSSHTAAFPRHRGDASERQRLHREPRSLSRGPGKGVRVPSQRKRAACVGVESSKAWSYPGLAKVGKAMRMGVLDGWDVALSKRNAQL